MSRTLEISYCGAPEVTPLLHFPESKSIAARELMVQAYSGVRPQQAVAGECDDVRVLREAIAAAQNGRGDIFCGSSATAMRFLLPWLATFGGRTFRVDGTEQLRRRTVMPLVETMRRLGVEVTFLGREGCLPLTVGGGGGLHAARVEIDASESSQFFSSLMLMAPRLGSKVRVVNTGKTVSAPYMEMTAQVMERAGVKVGIDTGRADVVSPDGYRLQAERKICADFSAASFFYLVAALAAPGTELRIEGINVESAGMQGDSRVIRFFEPLGVRTRFNSDGSATLQRRELAEKSKFFIGNMEDTPDLVPPLVTALAALEIPFRLTGTRRLAIKESDRGAVLRRELAKRGFSIVVEEDSITGAGTPRAADSGLAADPQGDHRMAMAMAPLACFSTLVLKNADCVAKSFPGFFRALAQTGYTCKEL